MSTTSTTMKQSSLSLSPFFSHQNNTNNQQHSILNSRKRKLNDLYKSLTTSSPSSSSASALWSFSINSPIQLSPINNNNNNNNTTVDENNNNANVTNNNNNAFSSFSNFSNSSNGGIGYEWMNQSTFDDHQQQHGSSQYIDLIYSHYLGTSFDDQQTIDLIIDDNDHHHHHHENDVNFANENITINHDNDSNHNNNNNNNNNNNHHHHRLESDETMDIQSNNLNSSWEIKHFENDEFYTSNHSSNKPNLSNQNYKLMNNHNRCNDGDDDEFLNNNNNNFGDDDDDDNCCYYDRDIKEYTEFEEFTTSFPPCKRMKENFKFEFKFKLEDLMKDERKAFNHHHHHHHHHSRPSYYCCLDLHSAINDRCTDCVKLLTSDTQQLHLLRANLPYLLKQSIENNHLDYFEFFISELQNMLNHTTTQNNINHVIDFIFDDNLNLIQLALIHKRVSCIRKLLSLNADLLAIPRLGKSTFLHAVNTPDLLLLLLDHLSTLHHHHQNIQLKTNEFSDSLLPPSSSSSSSSSPSPSSSLPFSLPSSLFSPLSYTSSSFINHRHHNNSHFYQQYNSFVDDEKNKHRYVFHACIDHFQYESLVLFANHFLFKQFIDECNYQSKTPLQRAYELKLYDYVEVLIHQNASILFSDQKAISLLHSLARDITIDDDNDNDNDDDDDDERRSWKILELITAKYPKLIDNNSNLEKLTAAHCAAKADNAKVLSYLLTLSNSSFFMQCEKRFTPLDYAVMYNSKKCVSLLLSNDLAMQLTFDKMKKLTNSTRNIDLATTLFQFTRKLRSFQQQRSHDNGGDYDDQQFNRYLRKWMNKHSVGSYAVCVDVSSVSYSNLSDAFHDLQIVYDKLLKASIMHRSSCNCGQAHHHHHSLAPNLIISLKNGVGKGEGVTRQWLLNLSKLLLTSPLFKQITTSSSPSSSSSLTSFYLKYNENLENEQVKEMKLIGFFVSALILYNPAHFPISKAFFHHLLDKEIQVCDVLSSDLLRNLHSLHSFESEDEFEAIDLSFSITEESSARDNQRIEVDLCENGSSIAVTKKNLNDYLDQYYFHSIYKGGRYELLNAFTEGFNSFLPMSLINHFYADELYNLAITSSHPVVDIDDWKAHTHYYHCGEHSEIVKWFWEYVALCSNQKLQNLLIFCTGSSFLPLGGFSSLKSPFTLRCKLNLSVSHYPQSQTCFYSLTLPPYQSKSDLFEKLDHSISAPFDFQFV